MSIKFLILGGGIWGLGGGGSADFILMGAGTFLILIAPVPVTVLIVGLRTKF